MTRRIARLAVPALVLLPALPALFGGWATTTVENLPDYAVAGEPLELTFTVKQHGFRPLEGLKPRVEALGRGELRRANAAALGSTTGRYLATITLPRPGEWIITIHSGFGSSRTTLMPLTVIGPRSARPRSLSDAEQGRRLFAAKACFTCHVELRVGPDLYSKRYTKEYVSQVLADPERLFPGRMPKPNLKPREIAALAAYLSANERVAAK